MTNNETMEVRYIYQHGLQRHLTVFTGVECSLLRQRLPGSDTFFDRLRGRSEISTAMPKAYNSISYNPTVSLKHACTQAATAAAAADPTGVFVGISYNEYAQLSAAVSSSVSTYTATGGSLSVAAGESSLPGFCVSDCPTLPSNPTLKPYTLNQIIEIEGGILQNKHYICIQRSPGIVRLSN